MSRTLTRTLRSLFRAPKVKAPVVRAAVSGRDLCFVDQAPVRGFVPLDKCVGHLYFGFGRRGWNPFTAAVRDYWTSGTWSFLETYYKTFQPTCLAEAYFLRKHARYGVLNTLSPFLRFKPWRASEVLMTGHDGSGNQNFGPVSPKKLDLEISRFESVANSISRNGYDPDTYGYITGYFLLDERGDYTFRITQGMHRAAVLDALGWEALPVQCDAAVPRSIHIGTLPYWPKVADGTCSPELARFMFRRHFWDRGDAKRRAFS